MELCSPVVCSLIINDASSARKIKSRIAMTKSSIQHKILVNNRLDVNLRHKLVKCNIRIIALYGAENSTLRKVGHKYFETFEMWCWRKVEKIGWRSIT
jgi:hypothetical protein